MKTQNAFILLVPDYQVVLEKTPLNRCFYQVKRLMPKSEIIGSVAALGDSLDSDLHRGCLHGIVDIYQVQTAQPSQCSVESQGVYSASTLLLGSVFSDYIVFYENYQET